MASRLEEPLSKEEQEDEEMRNELIGVGLFDENMDSKEMRSLIQMLKESREGSKGITTSKPNLNSSESINCSPVQSSSSFSNQDVDISSSSIQSTPEEHLNNSEKCSESTSNISYMKNINNESLDSELFEKNTNLSNEEYPLLGSRSNYKNNIGDESKLRLKENKKPSQSMLKKMALERWKLNPFNFIEEEDIPLTKPDNTYMQDNKFLPCTNDDLDSKKFDELFQLMAEKMDQLCQKINTDESTSNTKSQWGSPIKVGTSKQKPPYR